MKKAKVADLRNEFPRVARWIEQGEAVQITRRGRIFAILSPPEGQGDVSRTWPDLTGRLKKAFPKGPVKGRSEETVDYIRGER